MKEEKAPNWFMKAYGGRRVDADMVDPVTGEIFALEGTYIGDTEAGHIGWLMLGRRITHTWVLRHLSG